MRAMSIVHQQRSGGHAIISWLMSHYDRAVFSNANKWKSPFYKVSMIWNTASPVRDDDGMIRRKTPGIIMEDLLEFELPGKKDLMLISYEGKDVGRWLPTVPPLTFGKHERSDHIVIIRSFYNTMASRLAWKDKRAAYVGYQGQKSIANWIAHAKLAFDPDGVWTPILYENWVESPEYRRGLEDLLDMPKGHDETIELVNRFGFGSSFDRRTKNGSASKMAVLDRFEQVDLPQEVLNDEKARHLNMKLFGWTLDREGNVCHLIPKI